MMQIKKPAGNGWDGKEEVKHEVVTSDEVNADYDADLVDIKEFIERRCVEKGLERAGVTG